MHVAVLMAGIGTRLSPLTESCHKSMLSLGGRRIIDYQLDILRQAGVSSLTVVTGHGGPQLEDHLAVAGQRIDYTVVDNTHYADRNLDWSAFLALSQAPGDTIYMEGDLLVPAAGFEQLWASRADLTIVVDSSVPSSRPDTLVLSDGVQPRRLLFFEHEVAHYDGPMEVLGELVCLVKLSAAAREHVVRALGEQPFVGPMQLYRIFDEALSHLSAAVIDIKGLPWVEIDNLDDLRRAGDLVDSIVTN
ncbi:NTP transferase domain-containing protein [Actinoplanes oblitus]|uniref:NTP transferase domain-containing protein n=1 Tax=Actinoplanes oblitus TaxID=3040509 RepID=A0ABY8W5J6_9ACTN|nr:NTP transferase domain-containing protein [Actinoplanes oblitus]WIM93116.1 NTP transferase domain-containing protein [Actinoplanes oblitus]